jgi:S1-C subfamily serine protease/predicted  nucleic acid-binding Zn-ribbon protein
MRVECPKCDARIHVADDAARAACPKCGAKFRLVQDEEVEDDAPKSAVKKRGVKKSGKKRRDEEEKKFPVLPVAVGGIVLVAVVAVVIAIVASGGDKKKETANNGTPSNGTPAAPSAPLPPPNSGPNPNPPQPPVVTPKAPGGETLPPKNGGKLDNPPPKNEGVTGPYAALFRQQVPPNLPPMVRGASLQPMSADKEPDVPSFHSLMMARKAAKNPTTTVVPKGAKLTLDELKKACCFIKVETASGGGTGSGFLISTNESTGLVATNHHVIRSAVEARYGNVNSKVSVVFNSGLSDERSLKAEIVAYDDLADVAILRINSTKEWPKVLNPYHTPSKLSEGSAIRFYGFPLGEVLSKIGDSTKNPAISVGNASIASFRYNDGGKLMRIQINGTLNPGNSGGPIVDEDGRLVGLAVSGIKTEFATGIGFAVPVNDLIALLEGKLLGTHFIPLEIAKDQAIFLAIAPVMDPLDKIDTVFVRRWAGGGKPPIAVKDPLTGFKPFAMRADGKANLPGVEEFPLKKYSTDSEKASALGIALGELTVPLDAEQILVQVASQTQMSAQGIKYTAASKPVSFTLKVGELPVADDVRPFRELAGNPDSLAGRVVVVRARIAAPPITRDAVQDLIITDVDGKMPARMKFLVSRELAAEFDEVEFEHQPLPVRLVCLVGTRGDDGLLPVRITRLDFISRANRIVRSIPGPPLACVELANLNRDPGKFAGQTLTMNCGVVPIALKPKAELGEFRVVFPRAGLPRNLKFTVSNGLAARLFEKLGSDLRPDAAMNARITVSVPKTLDARTMVPITKLEILSDDKVVATIE